jgi:lipopolysaccharide transport system ATP-binding protein
MNNDNEVLVKVDGVSKKFCRDLKKSLWYGMCDVASELLPIQNSKLKIQHSPEPNSSDSKSNIQNSKFSPSLRDGEFWANKDISFELRRGECLGLVGHNGAGKTTLLKMLNGLIKPDEGTIEMRGRVGALIALGAGFNAILTGRENIYVNGSILGLAKKDIDLKIEEIIDFAEIREFIDSPVQSYSSGMQVRLGFAVASSLSPDILLLDEVLAVGDNAFKVKCLRRVAELRRTCATIFVSHEAFQVAKIASRILWLDHGTTRKESTDVNGVLSEYEVAGIQRSKSLNRKHDESTETLLEVILNGQKLSNKRIIPISSREPLEIHLHFEALEIPDNIDECEIITSIVDPASSPIASIQCSDRVSHFSIPSSTLKSKTSLKFYLPALPLSDGTYHIRVSVVTKGTEEFIFYAESAGSFSAQGYGYNYYKTILCANWNITR